MRLFLTLAATILFAASTVFFLMTKNNSVNMPEIEGVVISVMPVHESLFYVVEANKNRYTACLYRYAIQPGVIVEDKVKITPTGSGSSNQVNITYIPK